MWKAIYAHSCTQGGFKQEIVNVTRHPIGHRAIAAQCEVCQKPWVLTSWEGPPMRDGDKPTTRWRKGGFKTEDRDLPF